MNIAPKLLTLATVSLALASCGSSGTVNSDIPTGVYLGLDGRQQIESPTEVTIVGTGPSKDQGGAPVHGLSCKNKMWDPAPDRNNAINLMKKQAKELGFNSVHSMQVKTVEGAIALNCWAAIRAEGIAFNAAVTHDDS